MLARSLRRFVPAAALLLAAAAARADTIKVPADFETIQEAITAAATGDVIQVSKGVYDENLVVTTPGLTLKGKGATINGRYLAACVDVTAANFSIEGFTLVNAGGAPLAATPGDGVPPAGIHVFGLNARLSKLTIQAVAGYGIILEGTGSVEHCIVDACLGPGITVVTGDTDGAELTSVAKNTVTRCGDGIQLADGPFAVEKNTIELNQGTGLEVEIDALLLEGVPVVLATNISKNTLRNNEGAGLVIQKFAGPAMVVEKNIIEHNAFGADLEGFLLELTANTIDETIEGGVALFAEQCTLSKNKVRGNGAFGVLVGAVEKADGGLAGLNVLSQNTVQDNGGDGVVVLSSSNEVHDCTVKGNTGDGIMLLAGQTLNLIEGNKVSDNGHDGIDNSAGTTTIAGNSSKNNGGADIAGAGDGLGTVADTESVGNTVSDDSDLEGFTTQGELDLDTV